jgi:hypothetical protein
MDNVLMEKSLVYRELKCETTKLRSLELRMGSVDDCVGITGSSRFSGHGPVASFWDTMACIIRFHFHHYYPRQTGD